MEGKASSDLPPGFRFHPTDEELIMYYLRNQAKSRPCPVSIIPEDADHVVGLDDWVLCRIYKKKHSGKVLDQKVEESNTPIEMIGYSNDASESQQMLKFPRTCSLTHLLELDYMGSISHLLSENTYNSSFDFPNNIGNTGTDHHVEKLQLGEVPYEYSDSGKFQVNLSGNLYQQVCMNPMVYQFQQ
ncbi:hypothetical protein SCA6_008110 [Theobroma cacao]